VFGHCSKSAEVEASRAAHTSSSHNSMAQQCVACATFHATAQQQT
jgi:hypothetical protein